MAPDLARKHSVWCTGPDLGHHCACRWPSTLTCPFPCCDLSGYNLNMKGINKLCLRIPHHLLLSTAFNVYMFLYGNKMLLNCKKNILLSMICCYHCGLDDKLQNGQWYPSVNHVPGKKKDIRTRATVNAKIPLAAQMSICATHWDCETVGTMKQSRYICMHRVWRPWNSQACEAV